MLQLAAHCATLEKRVQDLQSELAASKSAEQHSTAATPPAKRSKTERPHSRRIFDFSKSVWVQGLTCG